MTIYCQIAHGSIWWEGHSAEGPAPSYVLREGCLYRFGLPEADLSLEAMALIGATAQGREAGLWTGSGGFRGQSPFQRCDRLIDGLNVAEE
jgi:hypothetical protein